MSTFMEFIDKNYVNIKQKLSKYSNFSEDIFHNTIIRCNEIAEDNNLKFQSTNDMYRYFIGAYKTNLLREKYYYYEKNCVHPDTMKETSDDTNIDIHTDISIIMDDIKYTFGEQLKHIYLRYVTENVSIQKLQKEVNIKNLKQKLRDIKEYLVVKYRGDKEIDILD